MAERAKARPDGYVVETEDLWRVYKVGANEVPALRGVTLSI